MTFNALCLILECWMCSRRQSTVGSFPDLCFLQFSMAQVLVGLRKQLINYFVFLTWACAAVSNNNNNNNTLHHLLFSSVPHFILAGSMHKC